MRNYLNARLGIIISVALIPGLTCGCTATTAQDENFLLMAVIAVFFSSLLIFLTSRLRRSKKLLEKSEADLREMQRLAQIGSWDWDAATDAIAWSEELHKIFDWDQDLPLPCCNEHLKLFTPESGARLSAAVKNTKQTGASYTIDLELVSRDAGTKWVTVRGEAKLDHNGRVVGLRGMIQNITERKRYADELQRAHDELERRVEERTESIIQVVLALEKSRERYTLAVESVNDGIWDCNLRTGKAFYSLRWKSMLGYQDNELEDMPVEFWKQLIHPADFQRTMGTLDAYLEGRIPEYELEYRLRHKDGSYRWILTRGTCCRDSEGKAYRMAGSHTDISRRKLAEQALAQESARTIRALEALREKEQMLLHQSRQAAMGEMIGNIAHQWRQPLNTLGLLVQQMPLYYDLGEVDRDFIIDNAKNSMEIIQHMSKTIDDFRNFFQPEKERVEFRVNDVVTTTLSLVEGSFNSRQIAIEAVAQDDLVLHGFPNEFSQVLLNILSNAKDSISERKVEHPKVTITASRQNELVVVVIADNAGGIPEQILDKIFDPYFTTKGPQYGTGVGLFMSKTIIEKNMGGRLTACNRDSGAEFRIEIRTPEKCL